MNESVHTWLTEKMKVAGVLACGLRSPDRKTFTRTSSSQFPPAALENACRSLTDTFHVLNSNRFPADRVCWKYEDYFLYGFIRPDGLCLAILTGSNAPNLQPADLEKVLAEFQGMDAE